MGCIQFINLQSLLPPLQCPLSFLWVGNPKQLCVQVCCLSAWTSFSITVFLIAGNCQSNTAKCDTFRSYTGSSFTCYCPWNIRSLCYPMRVHGMSCWKLWSWRHRWPHDAPVITVLTLKSSPEDSKVSSSKHTEMLPCKVLCLRAFSKAKEGEGGTQRGDILDVTASAIGLLL